jgi:Xaa-Pro aminopeptidase
VKLDDFSIVFKELVGEKVKRIGLCGYQIFPLPVYEAIKKEAPDAEIIKCDEIIDNLSIIKSENEIKLMKGHLKFLKLPLKKQ